MTNVDATQPPTAVQTEPTTTELLTQFWEAKQAREYWNAREKELRLQLADRLASTPEGGYCNKTLDVGGGMKLEFIVTRDIKVDVRNDKYLEWHRSTTPELMNTLFRTVPATLKPSLSGYNKLPDEVKAAISDAVNITESMSVSFKQAKDER